MQSLDCVRWHKGVLLVWVLEAKDLHKQDVGGKADPFVQLQTRVQDLEKTVRAHNLLHLLVHKASISNASGTGSELHVLCISGATIISHIIDMDR